MSDADIPDLQQENAAESLKLASALFPSAEHSVFLRLFTPFNVESVRAKIAGELKNSVDQGRCICFFESTGELYFRTYDELRAIVGVSR
jgi:hypothetical protein